MKAHRARLDSMVICLCLLLQPYATEAGDVCVGGGFGVGHLPMTDWQVISGFSTDPIGWYGEIYGRLQLAPRHSLGLSLERISGSASIQPTGPSDLQVEYDITAIPVNLTYEFSLRDLARGTTPFLGLGAGVYRSELHSLSSGGYFPPRRGERDGWGYGVHAYCGHRIAIKESLALSAKLRGRWADGMYFTDHEDAFDVDFTGVDLTFGVQLLL